MSQPVLTANLRPIEMVGLSKHYGSVKAVDAVDLTIPAGSLSVIVGPSGCGKSTLLKMLAGLESATSGELRLGAEVVTHKPAEDRDLAMVFQDYALYPHMTVAQNIGFGLKMTMRHDRSSGLTRQIIAERVEKAASQLGLETMLGRRPSQLSGGQQQRVALARAIVRNPAVLLLDEPLSALDAQLRAEARSLISALHQELAATMVMVTHDQHEALSMATHLVVMQSGKIAQAGDPVTVYNEPASAYVGGFLGTPTMNFQPVGELQVGWRAEDAVLLDSAPVASGLDAGGNLIVVGDVRQTEFSGSNQLAHCDGLAGAAAFSLLQYDKQRWLRVGEQIAVRVPADRLHRFTDAPPA